jgi:hypothetical protein
MRRLCATAAVVLMGLGTASADTAPTAYKMTTPFASGVAVPGTYSGRSDLQS